MEQRADWKGMIGVEQVVEFIQYMRQQGDLSQAQAIACRNQLQSKEDTLYTLLVEGGYLEQWLWEKRSMAFYGLPVVELRPEMVDLTCLKQLPQALQKRYRLLPYQMVEEILYVAVVRVPSQELIEDLALFTKRSVKFMLVEQEAMEAAEFLVQMAASATEFLDDERRVIYSIEAGSEERNLAVRVIEKAIEKALQWQASDIHLEALEGETLVKLRIDGFLRPLWHLPKGLHGALINRLKIMSELDIAERRLPQDGHLVINWKGQTINIRLSVLPFIHGEKAVLRILGRESLLLQLDYLGMADEQLLALKQALERPYGLILVSGPTGSGKTTTLYSIVNALKNKGKNIVTIEDPVEYEQSGINQLQINEKIGLTFTKGLRGLLRQDPDVIMIGEIRDEETAAIAVRAANTGHMVVGSIHTNNAANAVVRLLEMGIEPFMVANSLIAVIAQRLVRKNCSHCLEIDVNQSERLKQYDTGDALAVQAWRGKGCEHCHGIGYKGRLALQEIWFVEGRERELILNARLKANHRRGYKSIRADGIDKVLQGKTTLEEVLLATVTAEESW